MSKDTYYEESEVLLNAALARAAKQFPEFDPREVVKAVDEQHAGLMEKRPVVDMPMRELRSTPRYDI